VRPTLGRGAGDDVDLGNAPNAIPAVDPSCLRPAEWSWPPEQPWHPAEGARFATEQWAPASTVRHPWVRLGRWTLLYRR
jgi:hypothetical protein